MAMEPLILISNPGSASRKYAVFRGSEKLLSLHFEHTGGKIIYGLNRDGIISTHDTDIKNLSLAPRKLPDILKNESIIDEDGTIDGIGLRIVSPGSYFLEDRLIDDELVENLEIIMPRAPLHIKAALGELHVLREQFADTPIIGVSDSSFHATKPDYAWNYGISLHDADTFDIKRFGYHGLSAASSVHQLAGENKLPPKLLVCHFGSGVSITAVRNGNSVDNTMGYSPLEGTIMATRSGNIDFTAVRAIRDSLGLDDKGVEVYLNHHAGLLGLGGASGVLDLLSAESKGNNVARLALDTYVYSITKHIGQMASALNGVDMLVFTGTVGERSFPLRQRIVDKLAYLDFELNQQENEGCKLPQEITRISRLVKSKPIYVIPADENTEIARRTIRFLQ